MEKGCVMAARDMGNLENTDAPPDTGSLFLSGWNQGTERESPCDFPSELDGD